MAVRGRRRKESGGKKDRVGWNMFERIRGCMRIMAAEESGG
jgi:hypothetical protein